MYDWFFCRKRYAFRTLQGLTLRPSICTTRTGSASYDDSYNACWLQLYLLYTKRSPVGAREPESQPDDGVISSRCLIGDITRYVILCRITSAGLQNTADDEVSQPRIVQYEGTVR